MKVINDILREILRITGVVACQSLIRAFLLKLVQVEKEHVQMVLSI